MLDSIAALLSLIENSWINDNYKLKEEISRDWIGFWLNKDAAWIGQLSEKNEYIVFQPLNKKLSEKAEKIYKEKNEILETDVHENYIFSKLLIKDIINCNDEKKQKEIFQKWIEKELNKIL